jgi:SAM-dependent methyltransferase
MPLTVNAPDKPQRDLSWLWILPNVVKDFLTTRLLKLRVSSRWYAAVRDGRIRRRQYSSYDAYLAHQRAKLRRINLEAYDVEYRRALRQRLSGIEDVGVGTNVLCLAARLGTEVKAFTDIGCFAVGIDLNPGTGNRFVLHGDFHQLQFPDGSTNVVFTNSLDHCFDIQQVLGEVRRVLRPDGLFIVEAVRGSDEGCQPLFYESFSWSTVGDLVESIERADFRCVSRTNFDYPWPGEQLRFRVASPEERNVQRGEPGA